MTMFAGSLLLIAGYLSYQYLENAYREQLESINSGLDKQTEGFYQIQNSLIKGISKTPSIKNAIRGNYFEEANQFLTNLHQDMQIYENVFISRASEQPSIDGGSVPSSYGVKWRLPDNINNINQTLQGNIHFSWPHKSPVSGQAAVLITAPIMDGNTVIGILGFAIDYTKFVLPIIQNTKIGKEGYTFLVNQKGLIVSHPDFSFVLQKNIETEDYAKEILNSQKHNGQMYTKIDGNSVLLCYTKNEEYGYTIISVFPTKEIWSKVFTLSISLFALLVLGSLLNGFIIYSSIKKKLQPLQDSAAKTRAIANGRLDQKPIEIHTADEFGDLMRAISELSLKISEIIRETQVVVVGLEKTSEKLADSTESFSTNISAQSRNTEDIYQFLISLNAGITEISSETKLQFTLLNDLNEKTNQLFYEIKEIERISRNASQGVKEVSSQIESSKKAINEMEDSIRKIGTGSGEMRKIIKIIEDVSNKTSLLALNAAIEAARAGDQGLGFTVVAGEVAKLSDETKRSVGSITQKLKENEEEILLGTKKVESTVSLFTNIISSVQKIAENVNDINKSVTAQSELKQKVESEILEVKSKSETIQFKTKDHSNKTREAFSLIEDMKNATKLNEAKVKRLSEDTQILEQTAKSLKEKISFFKIL